MTFSQRLARSFYQDVHARVRDELERSGLDAVLVDNWHDVAYLSGFFHHPNERPAAVWISADRSVLLVPELEREHALAQDAAVDDVVAFAEYPGVESPFEALARAVGRSGRWGHSPALTTGRLAQLQAVFPGVGWELSGLVDTLRRVKA
ncbi:MAG: aminopeptidase P family N-terminal domain-containing protein, partial [Pseudonocardia sp.]